MKDAVYAGCSQRPRGFGGFGGDVERGTQTRAPPGEGEAARERVPGGAGEREGSSHGRQDRSAAWSDTSGRMWSRRVCLKRRPWGSPEYRPWPPFRRLPAPKRAVPRLRVEPLAPLGRTPQWVRLDGIPRSTPRSRGDPDPVRGGRGEAGLPSQAAHQYVPGPTGCHRDGQAATSGRRRGKRR